MRPVVSLSLVAQLLSVTAGILPAAADALPMPQPPVIDAQPPVRFDFSRFDTLTAFSLQAILDSAAQKGLPTTLLINRALEGVARRANSKLILQTVRAHSQALEQAREALGASTPADELDAGASALRSGIDVSALIAVRAARPIGTATYPLVVLTDVVKRGVPQREARDAVTTIARMPRSDDVLKGLQSTVAKNSGRGPGMAVDALNRYVKGTVNGAIPSSAPATMDRPPIRPPMPPP